MKFDKMYAGRKATGTPPADVVVRLLYGVMACVLAWMPMACDSINESMDTAGNDVVLVGDTVPPFQVRLSSGETVSDAGLRGRPAVLVFFNTACADCRRELPRLNELYLKWGDRVTFLCIGREQVADEAADFWREQGLSLPYAPEPDRRVYALFAKRTIPRIYAVDAGGCVVAAYKEAFVPDALENLIRN